MCESLTHLIIFMSESVKVGNVLVYLWTGVCKSRTHLSIFMDGVCV